MNIRKIEHKIEKFLHTHDKIASVGMLLFVASVAVSFVNIVYDFFGKG